MQYVRYATWKACTRPPALSAGVLVTADAVLFITYAKHVYGIYDVIVSTWIILFIPIDEVFRKRGGVSSKQTTAQQKQRFRRELVPRADGARDCLND